MKKMALQQSRIIRFVMLISIILLTIFIYASYYSNPAMTNPLRMHSVAQLILNSNNDNILENVIKDGDIRNDVRQHEEILSSANTSINQQQEIIDEEKGDNLAQYSNNPDMKIIIKFADKILKNMTTPTLTNVGIQKLNQNLKQNSSLPSVPISPFRISPNLLSSVNNTLNNSASIMLDSSKGILTSLIYESGHMNVNPMLCPDNGNLLKLLVVVTSAPAHHEARLAIRQTWGHYGNRRDVAIAFILGRTLNQGIENSLNNENYLYGDLVRGQFVDSYNNLTLKTISTLEWIDLNCSQASFVLKTDDDMFINIPKLLQFIDKHNDDKRVIFGRLAKKWKPIRNKKSKYYVSPEQFAPQSFPQFTTGPAYLMSPDVIHDLYVKSLEHTYLKLEDVFTTGIIAQLLGIKRIHVYEFLNRRIAFNPCNIRKAISVHMIKSNEQFDLWKKLLDTTTKCK